MALLSEIIPILTIVLQLVEDNREMTQNDSDKSEKFHFTSFMVSWTVNSAY